MPEPLAKRAQVPPDRDRGVRAYGVEKDQPLLLAILADVADAVLLQGLAEAVDPRFLSAHAHLPAGHLDLTDEGLGKLRSPPRSEEHTSELQSHHELVCCPLL